MTDVKRSRRGVYYDLTESPYEFNSPYGDIFKFSSEKKLEIYRRDINKELKRVNDLFNRHDLKKHVPDEIIDLVRRAVYRSFYSRVER